MVGGAGRRPAEQLGAPSRSGVPGRITAARGDRLCAAPHPTSPSQQVGRTIGLCCRGGDGQPDLRRGERVGPRRHLPFAPRVARARKLSAPVASPGRSRLTRDTPLTKKHIDESTQLDNTSPDLELADPSADLAEVPALAARAPVRPDSPTFAELGARPETVERAAAVGIEPLVRHPGVRAADRAARHRPDRPGPHRHRQDARLRRPAAGPAARPERGRRRPAPGAGRRTDPRARHPGRARPRHGRQDPRASACCRSTAASRTSRRSRRSSAAWRSSSARPAGCWTCPSRQGQDSPTCGWTRSARSCWTRPTGCSTSASSTTSRRSWRCCRASARRCSSRPPCRTRS